MDYRFGRYAVYRADHSSPDCRCVVEPWDIVAPVFHGQRGHPVVFGGAYREALLTLKGDQGARILLHEHREYLKTVACQDEGVLLDIDTTDERVFKK
ncbi:MAG: NTP transferase domain-containing protein [Candidatus Competibacteraceae bacterium]